MSDKVTIKIEVMFCFFHMPEYSRYFELFPEKDISFDFEAEKVEIIHNTYSCDLPSFEKLFRWLFNTHSDVSVSMYYIDRCVKYLQKNKIFSRYEEPYFR